MLGSQPLTCPPMPDPALIPLEGRSVCAVIVTHNRCQLLEQCLQAVRAQGRAPERVLVVDTASTDGTAEMLRSVSGADVLRLEDNVGGAGGFRAGMEDAYRSGYEWLWLMDDDTIPEPGTLGSLLEALDRLEGLPTPDILASRVLWTDGRLHPKNYPAPRFEESRNDLFVEAVGRGLLAIRLASFVSILVHRDAISRCGLPEARYFMWGDDGEYTARLLRTGTGYIVPASVVHHHTARPESVHHDTTGRYFYEIRNKCLQIRSDSFTPREKLGLATATALGAGIYLRHNRLSRTSLSTLARGLLAGIR